MADKWERTGEVNFKGLTDSICDTPKQTEVRNVETGETRWVSGKAGDDRDDLSRHIANGNFVNK